jgi:hypothetical protein
MAALCCIQSLTRLGFAGRRAYHEPGTLVPMLQQEQGAVFTYVNDDLGMPKEVVDQDGRVAWAAAPSAWGNVVETWRDPKTKRAVGGARALLQQDRLPQTQHPTTRSCLVMS